MRLIVILALAGILLGADTAVTVHPDRPLRSDADRWIGVNINYIRDHDANRPPGARPLSEAVDDLGARWLRFPGGEKSDFHRFAKAPYLRSEPVSLGWYAKPQGTRMDFDQYMALCRERGATPYVVVACDSQQRTGTTWDEQLEHAVAWVRYARDTGYRVRHWEIGNENWHNKTARPQEMAAQVTRFARAMKAVDPEIRIGASGNSPGWWREFLPLVAADLDFLTVSVYNAWGWKAYGRLLTEPEPELLGDAQHALLGIDSLPAGPDRERMRVIVVETNSRDYSTDGWPSTNTLGHAIVTFESFGRFLHEPRIEAAMLWSTRWVDDHKALEDIFYSLDQHNRITASGMAVALWGRHLHRDLLTVDVTAGRPVRAHASASADAKKWTIWLINRGLEPASIRLDRGGLGGPVRGWRLAGTGVDDVHPVLAPFTVPDTETWDLPPLSISVLLGG
jgi:hypothetical protein